MLPLALALQALLLAYHQFTTLVDLFPFNGVRFSAARERRIEAAVNGVLMSLPLVGFLARAGWLMKCGVAYYFILFGIECATWWAPYALGATPKWREIYARLHRDTLQLLPRRGENPMPNLEHLILMALTVAAAIATWRAAQAIPEARLERAWIAWAVGVVPVAGTVWQMCFQGRTKADAPTA